jgi:glycosyltransferase involved in cell wall biosynthesis
LTVSPKNILLLIPQLTFGGAERVFHDHGRELARAGHRVTECVFDSRGTQNRLVGLDVAPASASPLSKVQALRQRVRRLRQLKQELNIDVCISHLEGADYLNLLSKGREEVVLCVHNSKRHDPGFVGAVGWVRRRLLMPLLYRRADRVVTVSRDLRQEVIDYLGLPPQQVVTINNFVELNTLTARAAEPLPPAEEALFAQGPTLLVAGRLSAEKNQTALLPVLAALRADKALPVRLLLLGDGPLRPALVAQARALGLRVWDGAAEPAGTPPPAAADYEVLLLGFRANPFPYVARATVSVLPSLTEGFPMALCEALACGVPVASADCPTGPREILAPATAATQYAAAAEWAEFGLLLPLLTPGPGLPAAVAAWSNALRELLADPARRAHYVAQGQRRAADFGPGPVMAQWEQLIASGQ